ncbi:3'-5' exonuclease [Pseudomonas putida]|jgi:DNA polymerase III subunit epsilon|nr:3'-5' exonuclease [Pseudomonas putida]MCG3646655.1 3'-5' exonuclease [Pseudomonas putida]MDD2152193.1 3'-5' exonuclease [Pseudomonas putida]TFW18223.1 3'-5' exonuclease [Pseudomonas putida]HDS1678998.1 3'-5' exonuclease [Pseudomonas putida]
MDQVQLEALRAEAIAAGRSFSKGRLRDEFRMKPKPDATPVAHYKNGYGGTFGVYRIADCLPLRDRKAAAPSPKQVRAAAILALKGRMQSKVVKASHVAVQWLANAPLVLDAETTGLGTEAQIIELAIADVDGNLLFNSRIRPNVPIEPAAADVHRIRAEELQHCPTWLEVAGRVKALLTGRPIVTFNSAFDRRLLIQTANAFHDDHSWLATCQVHCAMGLAVAMYGATNRYGTISLAAAMSLAGVTWRGQAHSAIGDVLATVDLLQSIAQVRLNLDQELNRLQSWSD